MSLQNLNIKLDVERPFTAPEHFSVNAEQLIAADVPSGADVWIAWGDTGRPFQGRYVKVKQGGVFFAPPSKKARDFWLVNEKMDATMTLIGGSRGFSYQPPVPVSADVNIEPGSNPDARRAGAGDFGLIGGGIAGNNPPYRYWDYFHCGPHIIGAANNPNNGNFTSKYGWVNLRYKAEGGTVDAKVWPGDKVVLTHFSCWCITAGSNIGNGGFANLNIGVGAAPSVPRVNWEAVNNNEYSEWTLIRNLTFEENLEGVAGGLPGGGVNSEPLGGHIETIVQKPNGSGDVPEGGYNLRLILYADNQVLRFFPDMQGYIIRDEKIQAVNPDYPRKV